MGLTSFARTPYCEGNSFAAHDKTPARQTQKTRRLGRRA